MFVVFVFAEALSITFPFYQPLFEITYMNCKSTEVKEHVGRSLLYRYRHQMRYKSNLVAKTHQSIDLKKNSNLWFGGKKSLSYDY